MDPRVSSTTAQIPYDILISIIDELALRDELKDLSACSQTCRMLLHHCRVHLFSTVTIARNAPQFAAVLDQNPSIQVYIRKLTYVPAVLSKDIANALLLLSNLKTLVLHGHSTHDKWGTLTPFIQHTLAYLFSSPSVTHIMVYYFDDLPAILLSSCSNLKHLDIDCFTSFTSEACNTTVLAPPKLLSLNVPKTSRTTAEVLFNGRRADGLPFLNLSDLRSFNLRVMNGPAEERYLAHILRLTLKLEHLCLRVPWRVVNQDSLVQALTFPLPTLRSLRMEWYIIPDDEISEKFPGLIKALQALVHHPNNINEFNLILRVPWSHTLATQDWERIDQVLADRSAFRHLEKLSIEFKHKSGSDKAEAKTILTEFRVTKLPLLSLARNDYLDFQFTLLDDDNPH